MKKYIKYLAIFSVVLQCQIGYTQCNNTVVTNPANATNNALPDISGSTYSFDNKFLNGLPWWVSNFYILNNMDFNGLPYPNMVNIQAGSTLPIYSYLNKNLLGGAAAEEMSPQHGWELMLANLGYYPDNFTPIINNTYDQVPYLVFYNRYKGTLRVFVQYGENQIPVDAINGVKINLQYAVPPGSNNLSGIFRLGEGFDRSLDRPSYVKYLAAVGPSAGLNNHWMSGDFQLTYDPCVCFYPTNINLSFEFFTETDFKLVGRSVALEDDIIDGSGNINNLDFLSGVDFSSTTNDAENGYTIYKNMEKLADDYISELTIYQAKLAAVGKYNEQIVRNKAILNVFREVVKFGFLAASGSNPMTIMAAVAANLVFNGSNSGADKEKKKSFIKEVEKILAKRLDTYVGENYKKKSNPENKPSMPTAVFSQMNFEGVLNNEITINGPLFDTPGSFKNTTGVQDHVQDHNFYTYPVYNEPVGQFALLNTPKIILTQFLEDETSTDFSYIEGGEHYFDAERTRNNITQIKLSNDLNYAFNPALDYKEIKVEASFVITVNLGKRWLEGPGPNNIFVIQPPTLNDLAYKANIESEFFNLNIDEEVFPANIVYTPTDYEFLDSLQIHTPFVDIDAFKSQIGSFGFTKKLEAIIPGYQTNIWNDGSAWWGNHYEVTAVQLKLKVEMEFETLKDDGSNNAVTEIFTYNIDIDDPSETTIQSTLLANPATLAQIDATQYPYSLSFGNTAFNGQNVQGCKKTAYASGGFKYECIAADNIFINGNISVQNGNKVYMQAGREINVFPESIISEESVLEIISIYDYSNPMPPVTAAFVQGYCEGINNNDPEYKGNIASPRLQKIQDSLDHQLAPKTLFEDFKIDFNLYPNPTNSDIVNMQLTRGFDTNSPIAILMHDIAGRLIQVQSESIGRGTYTIDVSNIAPGIYFVTGSTYGTKITKRLIIQ